MNKILRRFFMHPHYKALAVLTAIGVWLYVQGTEVAEDAFQVEVNWTLPQALMTVTPLPESIQVKLKGPRNALKNAKKNTLRLTVDLSEAVTQPGGHPVVFSASALDGAPSNLTVMGFSPSDLIADFDEVGLRNFNIEAVTIGEPATGYMVANIDVEPKVVELKGPKVRLAELGSLKTLPIDVSDLRHDQRYEVQLDIPRGLEKPGGDILTAQVDVEPTVAGRVVENVPVFVRSKRNWSVNPKTVKARIEGPAAAIQKIRDDDIVAVVAIPDEVNSSSLDVSFGGTEGVRATFILPSESVKAVNIEPQLIKVIRR